MKISLKIIALTIGLSVAYGICNDLITAHLCLEYFTGFYPLPEFLNSPLTVGIVLGIASTWWIGLLLGLATIPTTQWGSWPKIEFHLIRKNYCNLTLIAAVISFIGGLIGYFLAYFEILNLQDPIMPYLISPEKENIFFFVGFVHLSGYASAFFGGLYLLISFLIRRYKQNRQSKNI